MINWRGSFGWMWLGCVLLALAWPGDVRAQSVSYKLQWDQAGALAEVQGYTFTLKVDAAAPSSLTATCASIAGVPGVQTRCTTPLPALANGAHTLVLTAIGPGGAASADPLAIGATGKPMSVTITIVISGT